MSNAEESSLKPSHSSLYSIALVSAAIIGVHVTVNRQRMWIVNVVWPLTALFAGPLALLAYFTLSVFSIRAQAGTRKAEAFLAKRHRWNSALWRLSVFTYV